MTACTLALIAAGAFALAAAAILMGAVIIAARADRRSARPDTGARRTPTLPDSNHPWWF